MYKRSLLTESGIHQDENRYYEDVVFWLKAVYFSNTISIISDRLYFYRIRESSIMNSLSYKHIEDRFYFILQLDEFIAMNILTKDGISKKIQSTIDKYISKHIYYGEKLINDSISTNKREYLAYYDQLTADYCNQSYIAPRINLCAHRISHDESNSEKISCTSKHVAHSPLIRRQPLITLSFVTLILLLLAVFLII